MFPIQDRLLAMCRGDISAIITRLMYNVCQVGGSGREELKNSLPLSLLSHESWIIVKENPDWKKYAFRGFTKEGISFNKKGIVSGYRTKYVAETTWLRQTLFQTLVATPKFRTFNLRDDKSLLVSLSQVC